MVVLARFVKIMLFTAFLAVLGPVLIFAVIMLASPGAHLSADVSREEDVKNLVAAGLALAKAPASAWALIRSNFERNEINNDYDFPINKCGLE